MARRPHSSLALVAPIIGAAIAPGGSAAAGGDLPSYSLTLIDLAPGDFANAATAVNDAGQVAGHSVGPQSEYAWRWKDGVLEVIGGVGGTIMRAQDINGIGEVGGFGDDGLERWLGWTWDDGLFDILPAFGGGGSRVWGMNNAGRAVGDALVPGHGWRAVLWTIDGPTMLESLDGESCAYAVSDGGLVSGFSVDTLGRTRAVVWFADHVLELEHPPDHPDGVAYGINVFSVVVGKVGNGDAISEPAIWTGGALEIPATLPGAQQTVAWTLNNSGQIVGSTELSGSQTVATTWIGGAVHDLNDLVDDGPGITLTQAWDISDTGLIVGVGLGESGPRAWIATPLRAGDLNGDGVVGVLDLIELLLAWGPCNACPPACTGDLDGDCEVGVLDLIAMLVEWG